MRRFIAGVKILGICLLYILLPAWAEGFEKALDRAVWEYETVRGG